MSFMRTIQPHKFRTKEVLGVEKQLNLFAARTKMCIHCQMEILQHCDGSSTSDSLYFLEKFQYCDVYRESVAQEVMNS